MIMNHASTAATPDDPAECPACAPDNTCLYHLGRRRGEELGLAEGLRLGWEACARAQIADTPPVNGNGTSEPTGVNQ